MRFAFRGIWLALALPGLFLFLFAAGCGGGGNSLSLTDPVESGAMSSLGGTIYTLVNGKMDLPSHVTVTLTPVGTPPTGTWPQTTVSNVTGSYQFGSIPKGTYNLSATATSSTLPGITISGSLQNVVVQGGIPSLNNNLLLGDPAKAVTFTGYITQDGNKVKGATVVIEVAAAAFSGLGSSNQRAAYVTATTDDVGDYAITVPDDNALHYVISAHTATSALNETDFIVPPLKSDSLDKTINNLALVTSTTAVATVPTMMLTSVSLPEASALGMTAAAINRLAVARLVHAPASRIAQFQKIAQGRLATTRANTPIGIVENDLTWEDAQQSLDVQGYYVYRGGSASGKFVKLGMLPDPFDNVFIDNDPQLQLGQAVYYTVTSYAANNVVSTPATAQKAQPLTPLTNVQSTTLDGQATVSANTSIKLSWDPVPGAVSYFVLLYTTQPSFNTSTDLASKTLTSSEHSCVLTYPGVAGPPVHYWWAIAAYDTEASQAWLASAATYSSFHEFTLSP